ncbi:MAG: hypothetical protein DDT27_00594 [Dehalococcoidia bacterium]|nr:hypothetical protein [Chloroflexota bacterium]
MNKEANKLNVGLVDRYTTEMTPGRSASVFSL